MRSILLIKTSSLGDVVHNLPVVSDLRTRFPDTPIDWVAEESFVAVARMHPALRHVIPVAVRRWRRNLFAATTWREMGVFRQQIQAQAYDLVLDTQGLVKSALMARLAHGRRAGYAAEVAREPLSARFYDATFAIPKNLHAVERNRWLAAAALEYEPGLPLDYGISAMPLSAAWLPRRPYCVLLTATSRSDKLWPEGRWLELAAFLDSHGVACVLPGGSVEERERAARLAAQMTDAVAAPPLALEEIARLLAGARLVVGVDTGLSHLAAALGKPVLALFSGSDPLLTGVHAGETAINLGAQGLPAPAREAIAASERLLAA
jgi:heptosyltransferase-1